ncbi:hypothetical protein OF83DRAFT_1086969 [Amylostereum chailletii]|nr:hypothetical protein OF83DRAFT_1086969 [Amylostereum chailletii]
MFNHGKPLRRFVPGIITSFQFLLADLWLSTVVFQFPVPKCLLSRDHPRKTPLIVVTVDPVLIAVEAFHDDFLKWPKDRETVIALVTRKYNHTADILPTVESQTPVGILNPTPHGQKFLALLFVNIFKDHINNLMIRLFDEFIDTNSVFFGAKYKGRFKTPALHLGVWQIYMSRLMITRESRDQAPEVIEKMDTFISAVKRFVVPKILSFLTQYLPEQAAQVKRAHAYICKELWREFAQRPALDLDEAFLVFAVKEGSSEIIHIDWNNFPDSLTSIVVFGDWTGGELCLPQLDKKFKLQHGQSWFFSARQHCEGVQRPQGLDAYTFFHAPSHSPPKQMQTPWRESETITSTNSVEKTRTPTLSAQLPAQVMGLHLPYLILSAQISKAWNTGRAHWYMQDLAC